MRINSRKIQKILGRIWTTPKRILKAFALMKPQRCIGMNATHTTFYLLKKIKQGFFLYYISCKEK
jgi:hypothetical protein